MTISKALTTFVKNFRFIKMRAPDQYLKDLLFDHDCVTIPGFGGFIMQSRPAAADQARHRIYPPSRVPSFNRMLNHDDGILISRVSKENNLSYSEAAHIIHEYASELNLKIISGEIVEMEGLGTFRKGAENETVFKPDARANFSPLTFGMESLSLYPVRNQLPAIKREFKPADRTAKQYREKNPASVRWTVAVSIPIIAFLLYGIIFPQSVQSIYTNYAGIITEYFHRTEVKNTTEPVVTETIVSMPLPVEVKKEENIDLQVVSTPEPLDSKPVNETPEHIAPKYYIIGGCFEKEENAEKFLNLLLKKGFDAEKAGVTGKGHTRISYKSFSDKAPALSFLNKIKEEENPGAWLLKY